MSRNLRNAQRMKLIGNYLSIFPNISNIDLKIWFALANISVYVKIFH